MSDTDYAEPLRYRKGDRVRSLRSGRVYEVFEDTPPSWPGVRVIDPNWSHPVRIGRKVLTDA